MKKIYSIKERILYVVIIFILSIIQFILLIKFNDKIGIVILAFTCIVFIVLFILKLFSFPYYVVINNNRIKFFDFPLLATNKFYDKKRSLIIWNNEIDSLEVEKVEIVKLSKNEKLKFIGYNHLFSKYLKVYIKNSYTHKYVYISIYTKKQINEIIRCFNSEKTKK